MQCNSDRLRSSIYFQETLIYYIKKIMSGRKNPIISPITSHCLHQYYSTFQWSVRLSLPILNTVKQYTLHFKTAFFWFPLNKPSEQIKMIKAGLVRKNASNIIIFLSQMGVNVNLRDNKALKSTKENSYALKRHHSAWAMLRKSRPYIVIDQVF